MKVKIVSYETTGPKAFWRKYSVVSVVNPKEFFYCRCDDYELFHLYETLPKLEDEETGEPKAKRARKSVHFAEGV